MLSVPLQFHISPCTALFARSDSLFRRLNKNTLSSGNSTHATVRCQRIMNQLYSALTQTDFPFKYSGCFHQFHFLFVSKPKDYYSGVFQVVPRSKVSQVQNVSMMDLHAAEMHLMLFKIILRHIGKFLICLLLWNHVAYAM